MKTLLVGLLLTLTGNTFAQSQCTYRLVDEYNREVTRISDYNCTEARSACERERNYQVYNGLIRSGTCEQVSSGGQFPGGGGQYGSCEVSLENTYGTVIRTYYGALCSFALSQCEQERINYETPYQSLVCRIRNSGGQPNPNPNPNPYPTYHSCTFEVKDVRNGMIVARHVQSGQTEQLACQSAYNVCQTDARQRNQYSGGYQNFVCQKASGGYNPGGQYVSRTCNVNIVSIHNHVLDRTSAQASGYNVSQVERQACDQATSQCREIIRQRSIHGPQSAYYNARCERY